MPLQRRVPKFGFKNPNRVEYVAINLDTLQRLVDDKKVSDTINMETFIKNGFASKNDRIKILGRGELSAKLNITVHKVSATAKAAIEGNGGSVDLI